MKFFKSIIIFIFLSLSALATTSEKRELIETLINKTSGGSFASMMEPMTDTILNYYLSAASQNLSLKDSDLKILEYRISQYFKKLMYSEESLNKLMDLLVPIYDQYYSENDLRELELFYDSNIGKKVIETMPLLMADSTLAGQKWAELIFLPKQQEFTELINQTLKSLGYE